MSSKAASAVYPALARAEAQRQAELRPRSEKVTQPEWAKSNDPLWSEPRAAPNGLDRVPGLKRISQSNRR